MLGTNGYLKMGVLLCAIAYLTGEMFTYIYISAAQTRGSFLFYWKADYNITKK